MDSSSQMSLIDEIAEILKFIENSGKSGIISESAMHCRLSACNKLFGTLREGEMRAEYVLENLPLLIGRFRKANDHVTAGTLKVYKSRVKSSVEDFLAWSRDPIEWEQTVLARGQKKAKSERAGRPKKKLVKKTPAAPVEESAPQGRVAKSKNSSGASRKLSFPIRQDFDVEITIPPDGLTAGEILRLQLLLYPLCRDQQELEALPNWQPGNSNRH